MENLNIPIYRAKKIDSDEYVEGCLVEVEELNGVFNILSTEPSCSGGLLTIPYAKNFTFIGIQK